jgi:hypothetical protein
MIEKFYISYILIKTCLIEKKFRKCSTLLLREIIASENAIPRNLFIQLRIFFFFLTVLINE